MANYIFRLPDIGEGIAEAEIVAWHVRVGDRIEEDGPLADMMTDKATVEIESPVGGTVVELAGKEGDRIPIGAALVSIRPDGEDALAPDTAEGAAEPPAPTPPPSAPPVPAPPVPVPPVPAPAVGAPPPPAAQRAQARAGEPRETPPAAEPASDHQGRVLASPAVRRRAADLGIDLAEVRPAEGGRIRHADLDAFLTYNAAAGYGAPAPARPDEAVRVIGLRRRIAENVAAAKRHIPHFTYVEEIDVTALEALRSQLNGGRGTRPRLTLLPLLITAICRTLPDFPMLNARYDDEAGVVTRAGAVHMGMATQTPAGLVVPVIRNAHARNVWQLAAEIARLAEAARGNALRPEELAGSTITITSLGPLGGIVTTPVINRPEVAIIGPNRIVERPMFVPDGAGGERIEKRKLMNLSISCDHRVIDGWDAASYAQALRHLLEAPGLLLA